MNEKAEIGVIGMAVMGSNLARNLAHHGYRVALFNRSPERTDRVVTEHGAEGIFRPAHELPEFVASIERPRRIILMVKAGDATDATIDSLLPLLDPDDVIIDGGNSLFTDTIRREERVRAQGFHFVGCGISGGEVGALEGPAIMPAARGSRTRSSARCSRTSRPTSPTRTARSTRAARGWARTAPGTSSR